MKLCVFLISYFMQGWAEDVAGMAYALRSLPEGAPCLPQVRASSGLPVPMGKGGAGPGGEGGDSVHLRWSPGELCHRIRNLVL